MKERQPIAATMPQADEPMIATTEAVKERPILFSGEMVRSILDGKKTQTRRVIKNPPVCPAGWYPDRYNGTRDWTFWGPQKSDDSGKCVLPLMASPFEVGDHLWVKETWRVGSPHDGTPPSRILPPLVERGKGVTVLYEANGWKSVGPPGRQEPDYDGTEPMPKWAGILRPSIFMPRWASRLSLEITDVLVQRVQEIAEEDAKAEGMDAVPFDDGNTENIEEFRALWDELNSKRGFGWYSNPWVWVVTFRRIP